MINLPAGYIVYGEPMIHWNQWGHYILIYGIDGGVFDSDEILTQRLVPFYLHSDGVWRVLTSFKGKFTGYYETKETAELVLKSAIGDTEV